MCKDGPLLILPHCGSPRQRSQWCGLPGDFQSLEEVRMTWNQSYNSLRITEQRTLFRRQSDCLSKQHDIRTSLHSVPVSELSIYSFTPTINLPLLRESKHVLSASVHGDLNQTIVMKQSTARQQASHHVTHHDNTTSCSCNRTTTQYKRLLKPDLGYSYMLDWF